MSNTRPSQAQMFEARTNQRRLRSRNSTRWNATGATTNAVVRVAPIPEKVSRVEENVAADDVDLTSEQLERLTALTSPLGEHHSEDQMAAVSR